MSSSRLAARTVPFLLKLPQQILRSDKFFKLSFGILNSALFLMFR
jgi:hypothetical protein